jgi:hypothetical protein
MKKTLFILTIILFFSCSNSPDFSKIKTGMSTNELIKLVGEPDEKTNFFGAEIWLYKNKESVYMATILNDTLVKLQDKSEIENSLKNLNDGLDEINKSIEDLNK